MQRIFWWGWNHFILPNDDLLKQTQHIKVTTQDVWSFILLKTLEHDLDTVYEKKHETAHSDVEMKQSQSTLKLFEGPGRQVAAEVSSLMVL